MSGVVDLAKLLGGIAVKWTALGDERFVDIANAARRPVKASLRVVGDTPYYGANNIQDYVEGYTHDGDYVLIAEDGSASLDSYSIQYATGKFWANNHVHVIRGTQGLNTRFLYHYLRTVDFKPYLPNKDRSKLTRAEMITIPLPVPSPDDRKKSLAIQAEIVRILDTFTGLTTELTAELVARKKQYNYYRDQLLSFEKGEVEWRPLRDIGEFVRGKRFVKSDVVSNGVPCIHYGEMYTHFGISAKETRSFLDAKLASTLRVAHPGDVIIVAAGETIEDIGNGTAWIGLKDVVIHDACFAYRSKLNPTYVSYFLRTKLFKEQIKKHVSSGKISSINASGLGKAKIAVPYASNPEKSLEIQAETVRILDTFTELISELPREIELRQKQYEHYRGLLLSFGHPPAVEV